MGLGGWDRHRGRGAGSEEGTHDWLTSGVEGEARPSQWLDDQPLPGDRPGGFGDPGGSEEDDSLEVPPWLMNIASLFFGLFLFCIVKGNGGLGARIMGGLLVGGAASLVAFLGYGCYRGVRALWEERGKIEKDVEGVAEAIEARVEAGVEHAKELGAKAQSFAADAALEAEALRDDQLSDLWDRLFTTNRDIWIQRVIRLMGVFGGWVYLQELSHGRYSPPILIKSALFGLGIWGGLTALVWTSRNIAAILKVAFATLIVPVGTIGGATVANPHCLTPSQDAAIEVPACLFLSSTEADLDTRPWTPWGLLGIQDEHPKGDPGASPYLTLDLGGEPYGLTVNASDTDSARFRSCMTTLYEAPAKNIEARAFRLFNFDHEQAHDIAITSLVNVCERYKKRELKNLTAYYWRSAGNLMKWRARRAGWERERWVQATLESDCLAESDQGLTEEEQLLLDKLKERLDPRYRVVIDRFLKGGSWKEIAKDVGLTARQAYDRYNYAQKLMHDSLGSSACSLNPYKQAPTSRYNYNHNYSY